MINWQAELRPGSSPEPHRHGRLWGEHQKPFITRLKRARVFGPIFGNIWFHETICCKVEKETAKKKRKVHLWNPKMPPLNELCRFGLCNLILATPPDKEKKKKKKKKRNYCENASVRTMDSDQTHKQKASLSKASASCQCFKLYTGSQLSKNGKRLQRDWVYRT